MRFIGDRVFAEASAGERMPSDLEFGTSFATVLLPA